MKRAGNLIGEIADISNLYVAYYKAVKSKRAKQEVLDFEKNLDARIKKIHKEILSGKVEIGNYHYFTIYDPKERTICAASFTERVLHHAIMNVCHPVFERHLINDTYATRPGKGTYAALEKAKTAVKKYAWVAKLDIRKYFDSIQHEILKTKLRRLFKDKILLNIFDAIIDSYSTMPGKGIPIGNLTSQYFANHYLSSADHFVKEQLRIPVYVRYMDDMLLFENDKELLKDKVQSFCQYVETELMLEFKPLFLNKTAKGLPFLGYKLYPECIKLKTASKQRFKKKIKQYYKRLENSLWQKSEFSRHVQPLIAFTRYAQTRAMRKKCIFAFEGQQS